MKVLLFCPAYRLEYETVDAILRMRPIGPMDIMITRDNMVKDDPYYNIFHNYAKGRAAALSGGYDAMFVVESDMIPPADALEKLAAIDTDVAIGLYMFRHGKPVANVLRKEGHGVPGQSYTLFPDELKTLRKQRVFDTGGAGLGCALIRRHVLEAIPFRHVEGQFCDWYFTSDSMAAGFRWTVNLDVVCGHKRPDGVILWPEKDGLDYGLEEGDDSKAWYCEEAR